MRLISCIAVAVAAIWAMPPTAFANSHCTADEIRTGMCGPLPSQAEKDDEPKMSDEEIAKLPRDQRRTKWVEGFTCERLLRGQAFVFKYKKGGVATVRVHEGQRSFRWSIKNDQFCYDGDYFTGECQDLPKRDIPNEKEALLGWLGASCLN